MAGRLWWRIPAPLRARLHRCSLTGRLKKGFSRLAGYVDAAAQYGPLRGPRLWHRIHRISHDEMFPVPRSTHRVVVRPQTEDTDVFRSVFLRDECRVPARPHRTPRLIVDAGAYVGYSTVYYAQAFPEARILAIEPEPGNFAQLQTNTRDLENVTLLQGALWYRNETLNILNPEAASYSFRMASGEQGGIRAYTIPDLMALAETDYVDILKLDIEGAEREVFQHADAWIRHIGIICVEIHDRYNPGCTDAFLTAIKAGGHRLLIEHGEKLVAQQEASP